MVRSTAEFSAVSVVIAEMKLTVSINNSALMYVPAALASVVALNGTFDRA